MRFFERQGKLWVDYTHNGKRTRKSLSVPYNKDNIKLYEYRLQKELEYAPNFLQNKNVEFNYFANRVLQWTKQNKKYSSYLTYKNVFNKINKFLNIKDVRKINAYMIENIIFKLQEDGLKNNSIKLYLTITSLAFNEAIKDNIIAQNPVKLAKKPLVKRKVYPAFNAKDIKILLESSNGELQKFLYFAFYTGARANEILGLKWSDINFKDKLIQISRARCRYGENKYDTPKTGERTIYLLEPLRAFLSSYLITDKNSFIFNGGYCLILNRFKKLLKSLNYADTALHSTRRSFIRVLMKNQADLTLIQLMVGHRDLSMINTVYSGYLKEDGDINKLDKAFA